MKIIHTHPANKSLIEKMLQKEFSAGVPPALFHSFSVDVRFVDHMDRDKPTGKLIGPDGVARDREGWWSDWGRFARLEESDLGWAIALGLVREEREPLFLIIDDRQFRMRFDPGPVIHSPKAFYRVTA